MPEGHQGALQRLRFRPIDMTSCGNRQTARTVVLTCGCGIFKNRRSGHDRGSLGSSRSRRCYSLCSNRVGYCHCLGRDPMGIVSVRLTIEFFPLILRRSSSNRGSSRGRCHSLRYCRHGTRRCNAEVDETEGIARYSMRHTETPQAPPSSRTVGLSGSKSLPHVEVPCSQKPFHFPWTSFEVRSAPGALRK